VKGLSNDEFEMTRKKTSVAYMRSSPGIFQEKVRNSMGNFSQSSSCTDRGSIQVTSRY
jgi:hypothetical protein